MTLLVGIHTMCVSYQSFTSERPLECSSQCLPLLVNKVCMLSAGTLVTIIEAEEQNRQNMRQNMK